MKELNIISLAMAHTHSHPASTSPDSNYASGIDQSFKLFQLIFSSPKGDWKKRDRPQFSSMTCNFR